MVKKLLKKKRKSNIIILQRSEGGMLMKQIYDANSIESLSFKDGVRTRISM